MKKSSPLASPALESLESRLLLSGAEPTIYAQYMLEVINWARANPAAAAKYYGIDLNEGLSAGAITLAAKQPLAFNLDLVSSARSHTLWMLDNDLFQQTENGLTPSQRMKAAGYDFTFPSLVGENIGVLNLTGTQTLALTTTNTALLEQAMFRDINNGGRTDRLNIMEPDFKEIGIDLEPGGFQNLNAIVATQDFAAQAGDSFLTGVIYNDRAILVDKFYTPGEGIGGVTVTAVKVGDPNQTYTTTAWSSGGYSLQVPDGTYNLTFSGTSLSQTYVINSIAVSGRNVEESLDTSNPPPQADLQVQTKANMRIYVRPGESFDFLSTVKNAGAAKITSPFTVAIYQSTDEAVTAEDTLFDSYEISSLNGNTISKATRTLTAPAQAGTYYLAAMADSGNSVVESKEDNNFGSVVELIVGEPDLTAQITHKGLADVIVPGDSATVQVLIRNDGSIPAAGKSTVQIWATAGTDGPQAGDVLLATQSVSLSLSPDGTTTARVKVTVPDTLAQGDWHITAVVDANNAIDESNETNNFIATADTSDLVWQFGNFAGRKNVKLSVHDTDGTLVSFSLTSGGWGEIVGLGDFSAVTLHDTTTHSRLGITSAGKVHTSLGSLTVMGSLSSIKAPTADIREAVEVRGGIASLTLGDISSLDDKTISLHSDPLLTTAAKLTTTIVLGSVQNLAIDTNAGAVKSLTVLDWTDTAGAADTFDAASLNTLSVKGRRAAKNVLAIGGDFQADLALSGKLGSATIAGDLAGTWTAISLKSLRVTGDIDGTDVSLSLLPDPRALALGSVDAKGWIRDSSFRADGNIGTVACGGLDNTTIFSGVDHATTGLPADLASLGLGSLKSLSVRGKVADGNGDSVINSRVAASTLGTVNLLNAAPAGADPWGLAFHSLSKYSYTDVGLKYRWAAKNGGKPNQPSDMTVNLL